MLAVASLVWLAWSLPCRYLITVWGCWLAVAGWQTLTLILASACLELSRFFSLSLTWDIAGLSSKDPASQFIKATDHLFSFPGRFKGTAAGAKNQPACHPGSGSLLHQPWVEWQGKWSRFVVSTPLVISSAQYKDDLYSCLKALDNGNFLWLMSTDPMRLFSHQEVGWANINSFLWTWESRQWKN